MGAEGRWGRRGGGGGGAGEVGQRGREEGDGEGQTGRSGQGRGGNEVREHLPQERSFTKDKSLCTCSSLCLEQPSFSQFFTQLIPKFPVKMQFDISAFQQSSNTYGGPTLLWQLEERSWGYRQG